MAKGSGKKKVFFSILKGKNVRTVFQPIVSLQDGSVFGYEALSRGPEGSIFESAAELFNKAEKYEKLWELEYLARFRALESAAANKITACIFLNVSPNIIHDKRFRDGFTKEHLETCNLRGDKIVFEITERESIKNPAVFIEVVEHYKQQKFKIAVDDAGSGYSGLNLISSIKPHYIKIDMQLIRSIDSELYKQALVKALLQFAQTTDSYLIAEGIETEAELAKLIEIGVHYGQGYFIQKPSAQINQLEQSVYDSIRRENKKKKRFFGIRIAAQ